MSEPATKEPTYEIVEVHKLKWRTGEEHRAAGVEAFQRRYAIADVDTGALWAATTNRPSTWPTRHAAVEIAQYCAHLHPQRVEVGR